MLLFAFLNCEQLIQFPLIFYKAKLIILLKTLNILLGSQVHLKTTIICHIYRESIHIYFMINILFILIFLQ